MSLIVDEYFSRKLKALSFFAVILVVFLHSQNKEIKLISGELIGEQNYIVLFIENFISDGIARIAVPLFFAISGLLFYRSFEFSLSGVLSKLQSRFKSLLVPYLFWSMFGLILILILQTIPWARKFFTKGLVTDYSVSDVLSTILINPVPYQLWFIRDLIMLIICSPILWYLTKYTKRLWLVVLALLWVVAPKTFWLFSNEALFFFTAGCALALDGKEPSQFRVSKFFSFCLVALWSLILFRTTYLSTLGKTTLFLNALNCFGILVGIISVWSLYDQLNQRVVEKYSAVFGYTFFIFIFHEPLLTILKKGMFFLIGKTNFSSLLIYIVAPLLAIGMSVLVRYILRSRTPRFYNFATGGR